MDSRAALQILRISNNHDESDLVSARLDSFLMVLSSFLKNNNPDWIIIKEISMILIKEEKETTKLNALIKCLILTNHQVLFTILIVIIKKTIHSELHRVKIKTNNKIT